MLLRRIKIARADPWVHTALQVTIDDPVFEALDPWGRHVTLISPARARRPAAAALELGLYNEPRRCSLCHPELLDERRDWSWGDWRTRVDGDAVAARTPAYFNPIEHEIIFRMGECNHVARITDVRPEDMAVLVHALHRRVERLSRHPAVGGVSVGCNFGRAAGASEEHLHFQLGGIPRSETARGFPSHRQVRGLSQGMLRELRMPNRENHMSLVIREETGFVVFAAWAPRQRHETHIMARTSMLGHSRRTVVRSLTSLSHLLARTIASLARLDVKSFNIVVTYALAKVAPPQPVLVEVVPRMVQQAGRSNVAFSELSGRWVVDQFPETSAARMREVWDIG